VERTRTRGSVRLLIVAVVAVVTLTIAAGPAVGHVTVSAQGDASAGSFARLVFNVPNEQDDAATIQLEVVFPEDQPIPNVSVQPKPGWTHAVETTTFDPPIEVHGSEVTEGVSSITWTGGSIGPGEFDQFVVSAGPLPEAAELVFRSVQTYDNGDVVRWIEEVGDDGEEPERPAVLVLSASEQENGATPATDEAAAGADPSDLADKDDVDSARTLSIVGIVVGAVGVLLGGLALVRRRAS